MTLQCGVQIELAFLTSCFAAAPSLDAHDVRCIESRARLDILEDADQFQAPGRSSPG